jgi:hypothetical protein
MARPARKANNLTAVCKPIVWKMWDPRHFTASATCYRGSFVFLILMLLELGLDIILYEAV